jgi:transcriptional regulator with PAS, ATPase and Fis domain
VPHSTLKKLEQYHWPGNIRELEHVVERAIIMTDDDVLRPDIFFLADSDGLKEPSPEDVFKLNDVEKSVIQKVLIKHKNNITRAAKELGLTRTSLYRRIEKYGL